MRAEATLESLSILAPAFLWRLDARGVVRWMNARCQDFLGVGLAKAREDGWVGWLHPAEPRSGGGGLGSFRRTGPTVRKSTSAARRERPLPVVHLARAAAVRREGRASRMAFGGAGGDGRLAAQCGASIALGGQTRATGPDAISIPTARPGGRMIAVRSSPGPINWRPWSKRTGLLFCTPWRRLRPGERSTPSIAPAAAPGDLFSIEDTAFPLVESDGSISRFIGESRIRLNAAAEILLVDPARRGRQLGRALEDDGFKVQTTHDLSTGPRGRKTFQAIVYCSDSTATDILKMAETVKLEYPGIALVVLGDPVATPREVIALHQAGVVDLLSYDESNETYIAAIRGSSETTNKFNEIDLPSNVTKGSSQPVVGARARDSGARRVRRYVQDHRPRFGDQSKDGGLPSRKGAG